MSLFDIKRKTLKRYKRIKRNLIPNFKLDKCDIQLIEPTIAITYISQHHYSKSCTRAISYAFGLYYESTLLGAIVYGQPIGMNVVQSISDNVDFSQVVELTRLFTDDSLPNNTESYFIGKTIKYLKQNTDIKYIISYADSSFGHIGCIYQATNFLYCGNTERKVKFHYKGQTYHARSMFDKYGTSSISKLKEIFGDELTYSFSESKCRYIYVLGKSKVEHAHLLSELKFDILPYPKADTKYYRLE